MKHLFWLMCLGAFIVGCDTHQPQPQKLATTSAHGFTSQAQPHSANPAASIEAVFSANP